MDPHMYQRQYNNGSTDGCFYEDDGNGQAGSGGSDPQAVPLINPRSRRTSNDTSSRRRGGSGTFSTDDETERPHATGPGPFRYRAISRYADLRCLAILAFHQIKVRQ